MYRPRLVLGFLGSLLVCGLSLIWIGSECGRGFPERSFALRVPAAAGCGTAGHCGALDCRTLQGPSQRGGRPHCTAVSSIACQCARSPGKAIERKRQGKSRAPRSGHYMDRKARATPRCPQRKTAECGGALGQRSERGHRRASSSYYEPGCRGRRSGQPSFGLTWPGVDDDAGGRDSPFGVCTSGLFFCWHGRQWESGWLRPSGGTTNRASWSCNSGESRSRWLYPATGFCRPSCPWIHVVYSSEVIGVWRQHGHFRCRLSGQEKMEPAREQTPPPFQEPTERARSLCRTMAESCDGADTGAPESGHRARRRGAYPCGVYAPAHVEDSVVQDFTTMLGTGLRGGGAACNIRMPRTGIPSAAPHFRSCRSHCRGRSTVDPAGSGGSATGVRLGGSSAGGAATSLAWGLPGVTYGSAPGQTRPTPLGSCNTRASLQPRCHRTFHGTGMVVPCRTPQPRYPSYRRFVSDLGLPCSARPVDLAMSSPSSTGRAGPVKKSHVNRHEAALWHLHASLALPFLSLCLLALYRVLGLCTDFWRLGCRSGVFTALLSLGLRILASCLWLCVCLRRFPILPGLFAVLCESGALGLALTPVRGRCGHAVLRNFPRLALLGFDRGCEPPECKRGCLHTGSSSSSAHKQGRWPAWHLVTSRLLSCVSGQVSGSMSASPRGTRSCPLPRLGRVQQRARAHRPSSHPSRTFLMLYLCCIDAHALNVLSGLGHGLLALPAADGVQLMAHGFHEGRPVFSTGSIPPAQAARHRSRPFCRVPSQCWRTSAFMARRYTTGLR